MTKYINYLIVTIFAVGYLIMVTAVIKSDLEYKQKQSYEEQERITDAEVEMWEEDLNQFLLDERPF